MTERLTLDEIQDSNILCAKDQAKEYDDCLLLSAFAYAQNAYDTAIDLKYDTDDAKECFYSVLTFKLTIWKVRFDSLMKFTRYFPNNSIELHESIFTIYDKRTTVHFLVGDSDCILQVCRTYKQARFQNIYSKYINKCNK